jgi:hypothetical protein
MHVFLTLLLAAGPGSPEFSAGQWRTDVSKKSIDLAELRKGGPPKDGIPAIDRPRFDTIREASSWLSPREPVLVVEQAGETRAYPLQILIWHELVNDRIGEAPILVSFCPLCNSAIVFDRRINGTVYDFGVSGMLRNSDMIMYDRQTDSLWQQITGEAIVGTLTGEKLKTIGSQTVPFETFARHFPGGKVLSRDTGHQRPYGQNPYAGYEFGGRLLAPVNSRRPFRLPPLERIVVIPSDGGSKAYPFSMLRRRGAVRDQIRGRRFVIFFEEGMASVLDRERIANSREVGAVGVFFPELDGKLLSFQRKDGKIVDKQTGSVWNVLGTALDGPLAGKRLAPVEHGVYFAFAWLVFNPRTEIIGDSGPLEEAERRNPAYAGEARPGRSGFPPPEP